MPAIRNIAQIAEKWATVTPARAPQYEAGVRNPKRDWATEAAGADAAYRAGVQAAIARNAFQSGVRAAGTDKWRQGAVEKGTVRFGPGVQLGQPAYASGFGPFRDVIERTTLPPRRARRDPANLERVRAMVNALVQAKVGRAVGA